MSESRPLVSIVTPSYNHAPFLEQAIHSVLEQSYPRVEYIVVDGGSTDGSVEIIERYANRLAWWSSGPDEGQAEALNTAFARATGELLGWLNSDDTLLPGSLERVVAEFERDPDLLLVYGDARFTDEHSRDIGRFVSADLDVVEMIRTCTDHVNPQGALFRRRALELAGPLQGYYTFDFEFVMRVGLAGRWKRLPEPLATFRLHAESKSMGPTLPKAADYLEMYDRFFGRELPPHVRAVEAEGRSRALMWAGELYYAGLELRQARRSFLRAVRLYPRHLTPRLVVLVARTFLPRWAVRKLRLLRAAAA